LRRRRQTARTTRREEEVGVLPAEAESSDGHRDAAVDSGEPRLESDSV
jgi:hypothetical protein